MLKNKQGIPPVRDSNPRSPALIDPRVRYTHEENLPTKSPLSLLLVRVVNCHKNEYPECFVMNRQDVQRGRAKHEQQIKTTKTQQVQNLPKCSKNVTLLLYFHEKCI